MLTTGQVYLADDRLPQLELGHLKAARHRQVTQVAQPRHQHLEDTKTTTLSALFLTTAETAGELGYGSGKLPTPRHKIFLQKE